MDRAMRDCIRWGWVEKTAAIHTLTGLGKARVLNAMRAPKVRAQAKDMPGAAKPVIDDPRWAISAHQTDPFPVQAERRALALKFFRQNPKSSVADMARAHPLNMANTESAYRQVCSEMAKDGILTSELGRGTSIAGHQYTARQFSIARGAAA